MRISIAYVLLLSAPLLSMNAPKERRMLTGDEILEKIRSEDNATLTKWQSIIEIMNNTIDTLKRITPKRHNAQSKYVDPLVSPLQGKTEDKRLTYLAEEFMIYGLVEKFHQNPCDALIDLLALKQKKAFNYFPQWERWINQPQISKDKKKAHK